MDAWRYYGRRRIADFKGVLLGDVNFRFLVPRSVFVTITISLTSSSFSLYKKNLSYFAYYRVEISPISSFYLPYPFRPRTPTTVSVPQTGRSRQLRAWQACSTGRQSAMTLFMRQRSRNCMPRSGS
jgi:hypothetical protein